MSISNQLQMDAESLEALTAQICCASLGIVPKDIILPLGLVTIPGHVRTLATEILFDPNYDPLHVATWKCIASLPVDIRRDIISNLLVIGGPAMLPGVIDRFFQEMKAICDPNLQHLIPYLHIIETPFPPNRHASIGAALFQAAGFQSSFTVDIEEFKKSKKVPDWTNYQN
jgi:actin-related protein 10